MEAWDIIVIGDGPAALRAAAAAAKGGASTLMMSSDSLGVGNDSAIDGIAAPLKESTTKSHRDDTIRAGAYLCDQDIVSMRVSQATRQVDLLERWELSSAEMQMEFLWSEKHQDIHFQG